MNKVLVVDDSLTDRKVVSAYLEQAGLTVLDASSAEEAMDKLTQYQPSLIVLDVVMGGKSGFEMCRTLKAEQSTKPIPIILCSSKSTEADKMWGNVVGADAYLTKPVNRDELINKVKQLINR
ncbi:response regulator receiver protein [Stanieria cyanosphaera PCC 7437]|uniref:Response regulator receiver protein n=1 Tax=Stanieria cyanosphaera (strain ATCC 29371 / PCC 7437) TaxID=111780 RepID=K9XUT4_STAC7|nr:response regulator [Stanieria cyanosphaera]AFZ36298.1 response regulator receiver protein [Stanieria cyanosphaera PCC 7437]